MTKRKKRDSSLEWLSIPLKERNRIIKQRSRENNPLDPRYEREKYIARTYGLGWTDFLKMVEKQKSQCAICKDPIHPIGDEQNRACHIDHCHTTGKVRGLLCSHCNRGLGGFKDRALLCKLAAEYLEKESYD
jgi:hypothetical protein